MVWTEREAALGGPRADKEPGSLSWCWQTLALLKSYYGHLESDWSNFAGVLAEVEQQQAWDKVPPEKPYGSLDAMLQAELGADHATVVRRIDELRARAAHPKRLLDGPGRATAAEGTIPAHSRVKYSSTGAEYLIARMARDAPEVLARFRHGEFKSVRAAADAAGIPPRPRRLSVPLQPVGIARILREKLSPDQVAELRALLAEED